MWEYTILTGIVIAGMYIFVLARKQCERIDKSNRVREIIKEVDTLRELAIERIGTPECELTLQKASALMEEAAALMNELYPKKLKK